MWADSATEQAQAAQAASAMSGQHQKYDAVVASIESFFYGSPPVLSGQAYDALRSRLAENELLVARGMRDYAAVLSGCLARHGAAIDATIAGYGHLDYDQLQADIDWTTYSINRLRDLMRSPLGTAVAGGATLWLLEQVRGRARDKQQRLLEFAGSSAGIYDELISLADALRRGMRYCGGMSWDGNGFVPTAGADDLTWRDDLAAARAAVEDDLIELARAGVYDPALDRYGGRQAGPQDYFLQGSPERQQLRDDILSRYPAFANLTDGQINGLLNGMRNSGCRYTAFANDIVTHYYFRPEEFEREFGFPLFREEGGRQVPNFELLVADLFCYAHQESGDPYNYRGIVAGQGDGFLTDYMNERSDGAAHVAVDAPIPYDLATIGALLAGDSTIIVSARGGSTYQALENDTNPQLVPPISGSHATVVTGLDNTGVIVSSWGNEYYVFPAPGTSDADRPVITVIRWDE